MFFAADYPFLNIFGSMIIFFAWVIWIWMVIAVLADVFARTDVSGWGKAAWSVFVIVLPFLAVLIYLIGNSKEMALRKERALRTPGGAVAEIERAKHLLDSGAVTQGEFDAIKAKALA
jgi:hypothetical protein